jgi:CheY-like chemotaxis protein
MQPCILVVDDDSAIRKLLTRVLLGEHYTVLEAEHGVQALRMIEGAAVPIHLVLTDLRMPALDGIELGRRLAARRLPVVYMSGDSPAAIVERAGDWRVTPLLVKPFSTSALLSVVKPLVVAEHVGPPTFHGPLK